MNSRERSSSWKTMIWRWHVTLSLAATYGSTTLFAHTRPAGQADRKPHSMDCQIVAFWTAGGTKDTTASMDGQSGKSANTTIRKHKPRLIVFPCTIFWKMRLFQLISLVEMTAYLIAGLRQ